MLQNNIIKEKSCGALVFSIKNNEPYILLIKQNSGHWTYPKGHVENNETEYETALREVKEETNLDIKIIDGFREVNTYSPYHGCIKDVVLFVAFPLSFKVKKQIEEVSKIGWFPFKRAYRLVTHASDQKILEKGYYFYLNYSKNNK